MKNFLIKAITEKGAAAIKQHWKESKKVKIRDRLILKAAGYKHELTSEDPFTILLTVNNRHINSPNYIELVKEQINTALKKNGASKEDYLLEVTNG